jgi:hypothetical protein
MGIAGQQLVFGMNVICRGCLASTMPASCGVRSPFLLLQAKQQATRVSHVESPRRDRGTT